MLKQFAYKPQRISFFVQALTHKSVMPDAVQHAANERLEFLGDAVLDAVVASFVFQKYPELDEGQLTKIKSKIVNRKSLSAIGEKMGIRNHLIYSQGRSINLAGLEGNAFEALIGAIYLDSNFETAQKVLINTVLRKHLNLNKLLEEELDFKSTLFIWCQRKKLNLSFELLNEQFIDGKAVYEMIVQINRTTYGKGKGFSKKEAEQAAAKETLVLMGEI
ncbi:MAG: ribonuclease III [Sphingomonadales bacterium]